MRTVLRYLGVLCGCAAVGAALHSDSHSDDRRRYSFGAERNTREIGLVPSAIRLDGCHGVKGSTASLERRSRADNAVLRQLFPYPAKKTAHAMYDLEFRYPSIRPNTMV